MNITTCDEAGRTHGNSKRRSSGRRRGCDNKILRGWKDGAGTATRVSSGPGEFHRLPREDEDLLCGKRYSSRQKGTRILKLCGGGTAYGVLRNLVAPNNPMDKTFDEIVAKLTEHYDPKPLIIVERYHFHKRNQASGESIAEYVAELRRLAAKCNFGTHLDDA